MGRHSRGGAGSPPPEPEPNVPAAPRYEPRSAEDTGVWDRSTYRVVDVGLPPEPPAAPVSFPLGGARPLRSVPERNRRGHGATRADLVDPGGYGPPDAGRRSAPDLPPTSPNGRRPDVPTPTGHRPPEPPTGHRPPEPTGFRPIESPTGLRPPEPPGRRAAESSPGGRRAAESSPGGRRAAESSPGGRRAAESSPGLAPLGGWAGEAAGRRAAEGSPGVPPLGGSGAGLAPLGRPYDSGTGLRPLGGDGRRAFALDPLSGADSSPGLRPLNAYGSQDDERPARPTGRYGATRADLAGDTLGATALAPREAPRATPEPDEVTDTGARRTRSTFHLAEVPAEQPAEQPLAQPADDEDDEPSLLLQWGVFVAQTLTGAVAGLGVWLGFYRLWSTWPFYAAPAVGLATILMLVAARTLRRRHGHDLDLMTAIVTIGIATVLTVLPATFTLQNLA